MESFNLNASCRLHGSPKTTSDEPISPLHRLQNLDLMDDIPLTYSKENHSTSPILTTPIIEHNKIMTPRRQQNHHHLLHTLNNDLSSTNTSNHKNKSFDDIENSNINIVGGNSIGFNGCNRGPAIMTAKASSSACQTNIHHFNQHKHSYHYSHQQRIGNKNNESGCLLRHRWQGCPELHKAMDGVNYIADHTKKEEESTKVMDKEHEPFIFWTTSIPRLEAYYYCIISSVFVSYRVMQSCFIPIIIIPLSITAV